MKMVVPIFPVILGAKKGHMLEEKRCQTTFSTAENVV